MPRQPYIPPRARPDAVSVQHVTRLMSDALSQQRPLKEFDPATCDRRELLLREALEAIRTGQATDQHIGELVDAANMAGFRLDDGVDFQDAALTIMSAKAQLTALCETRDNKGHYIARGYELSALDAFIDHYTTMMRESTAKEWHLARAKLINEYQRQQRLPKASKAA